MDLSHAVTSQHPTGSYSAVLDADGEMIIAIIAIAAMDAMNEISANTIDDRAEIIGRADVLILDCNACPLMSFAMLMERVASCA